MTQGELALLLLSGLRHDRHFLAGDTARSISYGVPLRFDEVRSVVHALCGRLGAGPSRGICGLRLDRAPSVMASVKRKASPICNHFSSPV